MLRRIVMVLTGLFGLCAVPAACSSSGGSGSGAGGATSGGCQWLGNCSSSAPDGAYDCEGNTLVQCSGGSWKQVIGCGSLQDSKGYACTCKGGCGANTTECSYAFNVCSGASYDTCGPNAHAVLTSTWSCQP